MLVRVVRDFLFGELLHGSLKRLIDYTEAF